MIDFVLKEDFFCLGDLGIPGPPGPPGVVLQGEEKVSFNTGT